MQRHIGLRHVGHLETHHGRVVQAQGVAAQQGLQQRDQAALFRQANEVVQHAHRERKLAADQVLDVAVLRQEPVLGVVLLVHQPLELARAVQAHTRLADEVGRLLFVVAGHQRRQVAHQAR